MFGGGGNLPDQDMIVHAFGPAVPSTADPDWISLKDALAVEVVIIALNGTTVTGSAVTLAQATAVAGTGTKALGFTAYKSNVDPTNSAVMANATATSNTFTTATTNGATLVYRIPIDPASLDKANSFDCIRVALGNAVNSTVTAFYHVVPKFGGNSAVMPNVIAD